MQRRQSEKNRKLADDARLMKWWRTWHREQRDLALAGSHGAVLGELFRMIKNLEHIRPSQLVGFARCIDWAAIDTNTKLITLHELNAAITKLREACGQEPIDDGLPGEPLRVFQRIRGIVMNQFQSPTSKS